MSVVPVTERLEGDAAGVPHGVLDGFLCLVTARTMWLIGPRRQGTLGEPFVLAAERDAINVRVPLKLLHNGGRAPPDVERQLLGLPHREGVGIHRSRADRP